MTTVYIAGLYEYQNGAVTKYYEGGAIRRTGYASDNGVFYTLSDHLRSTSVLVNQNGTVNSRNYFYPYGGNRNGAFSGLTTKRFTGQYHEQGLPGGEGLSYYNARWYDAQVGVFVSADTLVPNPLAPQSLNRYAYVSGNPLRFIDPTGHALVDDPVGGCDVSCGGSTGSGGAGGVYGVWPQATKTWTWPRIPVPATWLWPNGRFNAVAYTRSEMSRNPASAKAIEIRTLASKSDVLSQAQASIKWAGMVGPGREWDHKPKIRLLAQTLLDSRTGYWQQVGKEEYRFDTWSNIHFGWTGRSVGFSAEWLLTGASIAQLGSDLSRGESPQFNSQPDSMNLLQRFDPAPDRAAIALGIKLWADYGAHGAFPTQEQFIQALQVAPGLERRPDLGGQP